MENSDQKGIKKIDKLIQRIEMTLVNARRATLTSNSKLFLCFQNDGKYKLNSNKDDIFQQSMNKEHRLKYFDKCMKFYNDMKNMCEKLKFLPKENKLEPTKTRDYEMRNIHLKSFNKKLIKLRKESKETMNVYHKHYNLIIVLQMHSLKDIFCHLMTMNLLKINTII